MEAGQQVCHILLFRRESEAFTSYGFKRNCNENGIDFGSGDGGEDNGNGNGNGGDDDDYFNDFNNGDDGGLFRRRIVLQEVSKFMHSEICIAPPPQ